jgi:pimeloyl-ACP methyl ester carboxylesterase
VDSPSNDSPVRAELVAFDTEDGIRLHGGFYTSSQPPARDIGVIGLHGAGNNFYSGVTGFLSPALAARGYRALSMNLRCHDRNYATSIFEDCEKDLAAGVAFLRRQGLTMVVIIGHSLSVTQAVYFQACRQDPTVVGLVLSGGHDDLAGTSWRNWNTVADDPQAKFDELIAECRRIVERGDGEQLMIVPWWNPDPNLKLRKVYRETSAQTYLSYRAPESNCNASKWMPEIKVPILILTHSVVNTSASPEMSARLRDLATQAPFVDFVEIEGAVHRYTGHEEQLADIVSAWLAKLLARSAEAVPVAATGQV